MTEGLTPGAPVSVGNIPLCVPEIRGDEWRYVKECLDTNWVSSVGPFVDRFEREVAAYVGANHGVAVTSGTAALHIALLLAGVEPDDEVLVPSLSFIAPANAVRYCRAWPVFMDAEPKYWQTDVDKVASFLNTECASHGGETRNRSTGRRVKAILPVHVLGHPVDMDLLVELAHGRGLAVVEDATESLGARYRGQMTGSLGDVGCFSFNGNKLITTGGGGMVVTNNSEYADRARYLTTQAKDDPVEYVHDEIGYNYRLTNLQAAMGCAQLEDVEERLAAKRSIARAYDEAFHGVSGITPMAEAPWASSAFWMYTILVDEGDFGMDSRRLLGLLDRSGIQARPLWQPLHLSRAHASSQAYRCDVAERLHRDALSLPCSVGLTPADQERVIDAVLRATARVVSR